MRASTKRNQNDYNYGFWANGKSGAENLWRVNWKANGFPYCGVYVITTDSLYPCKIGLSQNPVKRLASLQTAHWRPIQISGYRWCESQADALKVEQEAHRILEANGKELLGEWFDIRVEAAVEAMEFAALTVGVALNNHVPDNNEVRYALTRAGSDMSMAGVHLNTR
jgi:hypothetical protein